MNGMQRQEDSLLRIDTGNFDETYPSTSFSVYRTVEMYQDMNTLLGIKHLRNNPIKSVSLNRLLLISRICYLYLPITTAFCIATIH